MKTQEQNNQIERVQIYSRIFMYLFLSAHFMNVGAKHLSKKEQLVQIRNISFEKGTKQEQKVQSKQKKSHPYLNVNFHS